MSRATGKKARFSRPRVYFFPKNRPAFLVRPGMDLDRQPTITEVSGTTGPEHPTERFYVPGFLAQFGTGPKRSGGREKRPIKSNAARQRVTRRRSGPRPAYAPLPPLDIARMIAAGHRLFEQGRLAESRQVFEALVVRCPNEAFPHTMLGTIYYALGDASRALPLFDAALRLDAKDVAARVYRGEIQLARGRIRQAFEDLAFAVRQGDPRDGFVARAASLLERNRVMALARR